VTNASILGTALTWFLTCSVFLMNVELGQLFHRRDIVDHATAVATETATRTYCARAGGDGAGAKRAATEAIDSLLVTATDTPRDCEVSITPSADGDAISDPGAAPLEIAVACSFDCKIPFARELMCKSGRISFASKQATVALGCDRGG
jgi:hypothetical protein